jgi:DNA-binding Xre family transcriptional regulator
MTIRQIKSHTKAQRHGLLRKIRACFDNANPLFEFCEAFAPSLTNRAFVPLCAKLLHYTMNQKEKILSRLATHLTRLRKERALSIRQLALASGLEYSQVQRIEKGKVNIAFTTLIALAQGLEMDLAELLEAYKIPRC